MNRKKRKARARELYEFFDKKSNLHRNMADDLDFTKHKKIHEDKRWHYLDLSSRAVQLVCRMQNNKPMIKDVKTIKKIRKVAVHPYLIKVIGSVSLIVFIRSIIIGDVLTALLTLIIAAILFAVLKPNKKI